MSVSGEACPTTEGSIIARLIWIEYKAKKSKLETREYYRNCNKERHNYRGIMPAFIHWFLQQPREAWIEAMYDRGRILEEGIDGVNNSSRICQNVAFNFVAFEAFVSFLEYMGAVDSKERKSLVDEHWQYTVDNRDFIADKCSEERGGNVFLRTLEELLKTGKAAIRNLEGYNHERADEIGFVDNEDRAPSVAYIHPLMALNLVQRNSPGLMLTKDQLARHLESSGVIIKKGSCYERQIRYEGKRPRVWMVHLNKLIQSDKPVLVHNQTQPMDFTPKESLPRDADGLI